MNIESAFIKNEDGNLEIDLAALRKMAEEYDNGAEDNELLFAKFIVSAYECGFDHGVQESEERHLQTAMLMMTTGGSA
jgi:hypothetical protein